MKIARLRGMRFVTALAFTVAIAATVQQPPALADLRPGTPLTVAPGVPAHGRAWELVTMRDPISPPLFGEFSVTRSGNVVAFRTYGPLPGYPTGMQLGPSTISVRGQDGWSVSQPWDPIFEAGVRRGYTPTIYPTPVAYGPGDETALWGLEIDPKAPQPAGIAFRDRDGKFSVLAEEAWFRGASADLQRVIFASGSHLLPADAGRTSGVSFYEQDGSSLRLLDVAEDGSLLSECGARMRSMFAADESATSFPAGNPVSTDARRVYFGSKPGCSAAAPGGIERVYLAELGAGTREISASRCTSSCGTPTGVSFVSATPSGSSALILTAERLTDEDTNAHADLYRYDAESDRLELVSNGSGGPDLAPTANPGQLGSWQSDDGSRVYFLAENLSNAGEQGIYLADASGVELVASTATTELVEISANGRYALLNSTAPLEAADTDGQMDVYRYDAETGAFTRVSRGVLTGNGPFAAIVEADFSVKFGSVIPGPNFRAMSEDGSHVFFNTDESLVPQDGNGVGDVYEWDDGDVGLISSGAGTTPSRLISSTPDGTTVFFETAQTLVPGDRDANDVDYYAARIGGGFAEPVAAGDPCPCGGAASPREQLDRRESQSAQGGGGRIVLAPVSVAQRRHFAHSGWIELLAEVPAAGRLGAEARARLGGRMRVVATTAVRISGPGPVQLRMRLSKAARDRLAGGGQLRVGLRLKLADHGEAPSTASLDLKLGRR